MDIHTHCILQTVNALILFSLLASASALAARDDNAAVPDPAGVQFASALQNPSNNDCYKGDRNARFTLRVKDLSALWHYATRILHPTAAANAAPHADTRARIIDKGVVWRVGTESRGVVVSANLAW